MFVSYGVFFCILTAQKYKKREKHNFKNNQFYDLYHKMFEF